MDATKWFPVSGYEERYEISSDGKVRIKARDIFDKHGAFVTRVDYKVVEVQKDKNTNQSYVILHDGNSYQKENLSTLIHKSIN